MAIDKTAFEFGFLKGQADCGKCYDSVTIKRYHTESYYRGYCAASDLKWGGVTDDWCTAKKLGLF